MMLVPVYAFLRGDTLGLVVLTHDHHTIAELASNVLQAAAMRVSQPANPVVYFKGARLQADLTVAQAGIAALDRIDVSGE